MGSFDDSRGDGTVMGLGRGRPLRGPCRVLSVRAFMTQGGWVRQRPSLARFSNWASTVSEWGPGGRSERGGRGGVRRSGCRRGLEADPSGGGEGDGTRGGPRPTPERAG